MIRRDYRPDGVCVVTYVHEIFDETHGWISGIDAGDNIIRCEECHTAAGHGHTLNCRWHPDNADILTDFDEDQFISQIAREEMLETA